MPDPFRVVASTTFVDALHAFIRQSGMPATVRAGATTVLRHQIGAGLPVDLFMAADWTDAVAVARPVGLESKVVRFASNTIVVAVASNRTVARASTTNWDAPFARVAMGRSDTTVSGKLARLALIRSGRWQALRGRTIMAGTVRQALATALRGDADAALVFRSDVVSSNGQARELLALPNCPRATSGYVMLAPPSEVSRQWSAALAGPVFRTVLARFGFGAP